MREFEKKNFEVHKSIHSLNLLVHQLPICSLSTLQNLKKLAAMVRGQLPPLVRAVLCALITIDVHGRDIITSLVVKKVETRFVLQKLNFLLN